MEGNNAQQNIQYVKIQNVYLVSQPLDVHNHHLTQFGVHNDTIILNILPNINLNFIKIVVHNAINGPENSQEPILINIRNFNQYEEIIEELNKEHGAHPQSQFQILNLQQPVQQLNLQQANNQQPAPPQINNQQQNQQHGI